MRVSYEHGGVGDVVMLVGGCYAEPVQSLFVYHAREGWARALAGTERPEGQAVGGVGAAEGLPAATNHEDAHPLELGGRHPAALGHHLAGSLRRNCCPLECERQESQDLLPAREPVLIILLSCCWPLSPCSLLLLVELAVSGQLTGIM